VAEPSRAVFLSYASQDAVAAERICQTLRGAGIEVWFDKSALRGGDAWDQSIRRQIKSCALFIPVISTNTHDRDEGYFRLEWKLAVDRSHLMTANRAFLLPVVIDDTRDDEENVPDRFRELQWTRLPAGETSPAFVQRVRSVLSPESSTPNRPPQPALSGITPATRAPVRASWWAKPVVLSTVLVIAALGYFIVDRLWSSKHDVHTGDDHVSASADGSAMSQKSIAVLPFADLSEKQDQEYFADGMAEELIDLLAKIPHLKVIGRTSSFQFKGKNTDLREVGKALGAAYVLEGSVRRAQDRIRVSVQLIDARDGSHRWSESYDRPIGDVLKVQDDIAAGLVRSVQVQVGAADLPARGTVVNPEAYNLYLRARAARDHFDLQNQEDAVTYYQQALKLDPTFVPAAAGLVFAFGNLFLYERTEAAASRFSTAIDAALKLDPNLAEMHGARAWLYSDRDLNWAAAEVELQQALGMEPENPYVQRDAGLLACTLGRWDEGMRYLRVALSHDPFNPAVHTNPAGCLLRAGRYVEAEEQARRALAISPTDEVGLTFLGTVLLARGELPAALDAFRQVNHRHYRLVGLTAVYQAMGYRAESDQAMRQLEAEAAAEDPYEIAEGHAYRGEIEAALKWLERAGAQKDPDISILAKGDPAFARYVGDQRYRAWLRKMNLPE
jgi:TolB-like protein/Tfp pilus assembly protein PilF